ncbi:MAG: hypothetical protein Fur0039_21970 [Rhodocyclaceae bacterium]
MNAIRVPVLMYHRVGDARNPWEARYAIGTAQFAAHMRALAQKGYRAVGIDTFADWLEGKGDLPDGAFVLTFDDGFLGVGLHAWPILRELAWPFTIFLVSGMLGGQDEWTRTSNPSGTTHPLLAERDIVEMQAYGVSFHSHTRTHPSLTAISRAQLADELAGSRQRLEQVLGREVAYLAYPYGHVDERVEAAARDAGYRAAFSTRPGFNRRDVERFRIRRLDIFGTDTPAMLMRKIRFGTNDGTLAHATRYYLERMRARACALLP